MALTLRIKKKLKICQEKKKVYLFYFSVLFKIPRSLTFCYHISAQYGCKEHTGSDF